MHADNQISAGRLHGARRSFGDADRRWAALPRAPELARARWPALALLSGIGAALALCYNTSDPRLAAAGLLLLGGLALLNPSLALLFVPLTAPLFLWSPPSAPNADLPPHELALLATAAAVVARLIFAWLFAREVTGPRGGEAKLIASAPGRLAALNRVVLAGYIGSARAWAARYAPELLLLAAGTVGLLVAVPEPEARRDSLRAFRWFIAEPLIFITLVRGFTGRARRPQYALYLAGAFVAGGTAVACLGLLQALGYNLLAGQAPQTAAQVSLFSGAWRATSVYGNPNNLGLYLDRVWPVAAALALAALAGRRNATALSCGMCALLCLGGILVSFSRGAWLGVGAALVVLAWPYASGRLGSRLLAGAIVGGATLALVGALIFELRGGLAGGSSTVRLLFWRESLALLRRHPFGLGLDQFFYYHHPAYGRSLISPLLANTQERYARQPHNLIFELWMNLGPAGLLAFAALLAPLARRAGGLLAAGQAAPAVLARGVLAALAAALVHGMVDTFYFWPDIAIGFWLLLALAECSSAGPAERNLSA